jgi:5-methylcytosine-specific restriction endonuclease McrA
MEKASRVNRRKCIEMDGKCMWCGTVNDLEPHHIIHSSQGGRDFLWNLITLCHGCHLILHHGMPDGTGNRIPEKVLIVKLLSSYVSMKIFRWKIALDWWKGKL